MIGATLTVVKTNIAGPGNGTTEWTGYERSVFTVCNNLLSFPRQIISSPCLSNPENSQVTLINGSSSLGRNMSPVQWYFRTVANEMFCNVHGVSASETLPLMSGALYQITLKSSSSLDGDRGPDNLSSRVKWLPTAHMVQNGISPDRWKNLDKGPTKMLQTMCQNRLFSSMREGRKSESIPLQNKCQELHKKPILSTLRLDERWLLLCQNPGNARRRK